VAYHCLGMQCSAPLENIQDLLGALAEGPGEGPKNTV